VAIVEESFNLFEEGKNTAAGNAAIGGAMRTIPNTEQNIKLEQELTKPLTESYSVNIVAPI
jgi:hypothetical protein